MSIRETQWKYFVKETSLGNYVLITSIWYIRENDIYAPTVNLLSLSGFWTELHGKTHTFEASIHYYIIGIYEYHIYGQRHAC